MEDFSTHKSVNKIIMMAISVYLPMLIVFCLVWLWPMPPPSHKVRIVRFGKDCTRGRATAHKILTHRFCLDVAGVIKDYAIPNIQNISYEHKWAPFKAAYEKAACDLNEWTFIHNIADNFKWNYYRFNVTIKLGGVGSYSLYNILHKNDLMSLVREGNFIIVDSIRIVKADLNPREPTMACLDSINLPGMDLVCRPLNTGLLKQLYASVFSANTLQNGRVTLELNIWIAEPRKEASSLWKTIIEYTLLLGDAKDVKPEFIMSERSIGLATEYNMKKYARYYK